MATGKIETNNRQLVASGTSCWAYKSGKTIVVTVDGYWTNSAAVPIILTLPAGARPDATARGVCAGTNSKGYCSRLLVEASGDVKLVPRDASAEYHYGEVVFLLP